MPSNRFVTSIGALLGWWRRHALGVAVAGSLAVLLLLLAPMPAVDRSSLPGSSSKLAHIVLFAGLALLWFAVRVPRVWRFVVAFTVPMAIAVLSEWLQGRTSWRTGSWQDLVADGIGIALMICIACIYVWMKRR